MHLCSRQLRDINDSDILNNGLYRKCNVYKGGGGYDKFPLIYKQRIGNLDVHNQFVVQLRGCPLRCPYCYVTLDGVLTGECDYVNTEKLVTDFDNSGCSVFHLMGGAPALYIDHWPELLNQLNGKVFHSDLLLLEGEYKKDTLSKLSPYSNSLYAVSIKGYTEEEFYRNTGVRFNRELFHKNLALIIEQNLPFYFTYTGMENSSIEAFSEYVIQNFGESYLKDSFSIDIIHYNALD